MKTRTFDLFVTEADFDKDEVQIGKVQFYAINRDDDADNTDDTYVTGATLTDTQSLITALRGASTNTSFKPIVRFINKSEDDDRRFGRRGHYTVLRIEDNAFFVDRPIDNASGDNICMLVHQSSEPVLRLNNRFQHVVAAELLAYTLVGLSSLSQTIEDDVPMIDFVGLEIKELPGRTMSTNRYMQNMFAILTTLPVNYRSVEYYLSSDAMIFVPPGMMKVEYEEPISNVGTISPRLTDRKGQQVTVARFHMWLRVTVLDKK